MRLFVALDIPEPIRIQIARYVDEMRRIAPDSNWVRTDGYHVTLKFIGEWRRDVQEVVSALDLVTAEPLDLAIRGCGFFPHARAPRVFWVGIEADDRLASLAYAVDQSCSKLGIPSEERDFSPHLTLARSGSGSPRPKPGDRMTPAMKRLAERIAGIPAPDFGTMHATEFFLYESKLSRGGAQYTKLKSFAF